MASLNDTPRYSRITVGNLWFDVCNICHTISIDNPGHDKFHANIKEAINAVHLRAAKAEADLSNIRMSYG
jgi:hypothetical protein